MRKLICSIFLTLISSALGACSSPTENFLSFAESTNLNHSNLSAKGFELKTFSNRIQGDDLVVYLDGDGTPWFKGVRPALDPTPRNPLTLQLMQQDTRPAVYIGRPCYFELGPMALCNNLLWTQARYAETIVAAMNSALEQIIQQRQAKHVQLIGFSGGGALAVLIASRRNDISSVITVAGNLDTVLWVKQHNYLPLIDSLNPALTSSLNIPSLHLTGTEDLAVPSAITRSYLKNHSGYYWPFPNFDHHCCWLEAWPHILQQSQQHLNTVELD